ncbi:MAG: ATP-dependent zinc metalloprotease FtsH [bacterium ADurb.Bin212]|nr:MAG: ATP-dependent zinc metalloprotease FtsH [bacterium ADurb.Bin212]
MASPRKNNSIAIWIIFIILIAISIASYYSNDAQKPAEVSLSEVSSLVAEGKIEEIIVEDNQITAKLKDGETKKSVKESGVGLNEYGITPDKTKITVKDSSASYVWLSVVTSLLPIILIGAFFWFLFRGAQGANSKAMSFGKSSAKLSLGTKTSFKDVAGLVEPKQELVEIVEFLKSPKKFRDLGAEIPKGVLLVGPPGTGKTLLAKAVAGEAGVPFFSISASEFVEMFVGVGASRVRDLFTKAKRNAPSIIFVDELDAIGRQRGSGLGGSHDEREQTLNQILVEMDGFDTKDNVIVMAATNRPDVLDPALMRPGRFDRQVVIDLPDKNERLEILKVHIKNKPVDKSLNLNKIASTTAGFSGADLRNLANEAAILAARADRKIVNSQDFDEAIEKVMLGPERRSRILSEKEKEITAVHESGHAVVSHFLPNSDPVHKISIVSRGMALGFTWNMPREDSRLQTKAKFMDEISSLLAGRVAEEVFFGEENITTGAQNDLKRATNTARKMVVEYGMSDKLGAQTYGHSENLPFLGKDLAEHRNYSEEIASMIDKEVSRIITSGKMKAHEIIVGHKNDIKKLSEKLLKEETISDEEFLVAIGENQPKEK